MDASGDDTAKVRKRRKWGEVKERGGRRERSGG